MLSWKKWPECFLNEFHCFLFLDLDKIESGIQTTISTLRTIRHDTIVLFFFNVQQKADG